MKKLFTKYSAYAIILVMLLLLIPSITARIENEKKNENITVSVLYNDLANKVIKTKLYSSLNQFKEIGVNTVSLMEDDLNAMVARGDVTCIKYNVLRHKYDDESMEMAEFIKEKYPDINFDSYVVIASRDSAKEKLAYSLPRRYDAKDYADIGVFDDLYVYILHDGRRQMWDYSFGFDEEIIDELAQNGFNVSLIHKVKNYAKQDYLDDLERIIKENNIEYLNLKMDSREPKADEIIDANYTRLADIINENDMTLVVTENTDQLSNQKFMGYNYVFDSIMSEGGSQKVLRSYETYDDSQMNETIYSHRVEQFFNSTINRNIRFITVTQLAPTSISYDECADYTFTATKIYKEKIEDVGFVVNAETSPLDYQVNVRFPSAVCAVIMIMCAVIMLQLVFSKTSLIVTIAGIVLSALSFLLTFKLPLSLVYLYPTVYCVVMSCMAITLTLAFIKRAKDRIGTVLLVISSVVIMVSTLLLGAVGMGSMVSGIGYYMNNLIFRGIKISLIIPVIYTTVIYYLMFVKNEKSNLIKDVQKVLVSDIKVYWVIIAGAVGAVGLYYIIRSGNVNSISSLEHAMRNFVTDLFPARPRTKEFLIGYPALVLFAYYAKNVKVQLVKWLLAIASSILAASITNSFCHVFTDFSTIVTRTLNGLVLGIVVATAFYIANIIFLKILSVIKEKVNGDNVNG